AAQPELRRAAEAPRAAHGDAGHVPQRVAQVANAARLEVVGREDADGAADFARLERCRARRHDDLLRALLRRGGRYGQSGCGARERERETARHDLDARHSDLRSLKRRSILLEKEAAAGPRPSLTVSERALTCRGCRGAAPARHWRMPGRRDCEPPPAARPCGTRPGDTRDTQDMRGPP